jgi:hypothetical protein
VVYETHSSHDIGEAIMSSIVTDPPAVTPEWPEHEKLHLVVERSQSIGEFIEWLEGKGIWLESNGRRTPGISELLAEFFDIDQDALEAEKVAMLEALRAQAGAQ